MAVFCIAFIGALSVYAIVGKTDSQFFAFGKFLQFEVILRTCIIIRGVPIWVFKHVPISDIDSTKKADN